MTSTSVSSTTTSASATPTPSPTDEVTRATLRAAQRPRSLSERLLNANLWLVFVFFYAPILILVLFSFNSGRFVSRWEGFSLQWYVTLFQNDAIGLALRNSLIVATISTVVSTALATLVAVGMERFDFRSKTAMDSVLYLPIIIPDIAMAVMLLLFFVQAGQALGLIGFRFSLGLTTVILAHVAFNVAFVTVTVRARLADFDRSLEEAARDLYANEWATFRYVTLPLIMPGILAGALLAFTMSLDDFVVTFFTSGPGSTTLPLRIYSMVKTGITPEINALSTLMLFASMLLVFASLLLQRRQA
jgi:spermidine/putrescine transport system permease protein